MAKGKSTTVFFCQSCGYESVKWMGQCPGCRQWNTFVEESVVTKSRETGVKKTEGLKSRPASLSEISLEEEDRITTRMQELDRVLGGGLVKGSLTLVGGDPGIGKSTSFSRCAGTWQRTDGRFCMFRGRNHLSRLKSGPTALGSFMSV